MRSARSRRHVFGVKTEMELAIVYASEGASNRTEMLRLRGVSLTILRLLGLRARLLSILAW